MPENEEITFKGWIILESKNDFGSLSPQEETKKGCCITESNLG